MVRVEVSWLLPGYSLTIDHRQFDIESGSLCGYRYLYSSVPNTSSLLSSCSPSRRCFTGTFSECGREPEVQGCRNSCVCVVGQEPRPHSGLTRHDYPVLPSSLGWSLKSTKLWKSFGMLIEDGTDVSAQYKGGSTPLHLASTQHFTDVSPQRYAEVARLLLEYGSDMTVQDKARRTPFDLASLGHGAEPGTYELRERVLTEVYAQGTSLPVVTVNHRAGPKVEEMKRRGERSDNDNCAFIGGIALLLAARERVSRSRRIARPFVNALAPTSWKGTWACLLGS